MHLRVPVILLNFVVLGLLMYSCLYTIENPTVSTASAADVSCSEAALSTSLIASKSYVAANQDKNRLMSNRQWIDLFDDVLRSDFDVRILNAMYDDGVFESALKWASDPPESRSEFLFFDWLNWTLAPRFDMGMQAKLPREISTLPKQLDVMQKMISLGISQLRHDPAFQILFDRVSGSPMNASTKAIIAQPLRRVISAYADIMQIVLQLLTDLNATTREKNLLGKMQDIRSARRNENHENLAAQFRGEPDEYIVYDNPSFFQQGVNPTGLGTHDWKFWEGLRPVLQCSSVVRLCEIPDGCRFVCNMQYIKKIADSADGLHLVGFGSNNEWQWERSVIRHFGVKRISSITTLDCTVGSGARQWRPDPFLTLHEVGFGYASECLGKSQTHDSITVKNLKKILRETLALGNVGGTNYDVQLGEGKKVQVTRFPVKASSRPQGSAAHQIHILKIDVEGLEAFGVASWLESYLVDLAKRRAKYSANSTFSFFDDDDNSDFLPIDIVQVEYHRIGKISEPNSEAFEIGHSMSSEAVLSGHLFVLHMAALGYLMVAQEQNFYNRCCYEYVFVHTRFFMESEVASFLDG